MYIALDACRVCTRLRSNRKCGPGRPVWAIATSAVSTFLVGLLAEHAEDLGEPYARHLGGKVRELRFHLLRQQTRVTYWLAPGRRVILLTVFPKTRSAETAEVAPCLAFPEDLRSRTRHGPPGVRPGGELT